MMKKIITLIASLAAAICAFGQDAAILDKIEKANASMKSVQCNFTENRILTATGRKFDCAGTVYFQGPDRMAMRFSKPATDLVVIDGKTYHMNRFGKPMTFDTEKAPLMRSLRNTLLYCITGQPRKVAVVRLEGKAVQESTLAQVGVYLSLWVALAISGTLLVSLESSDFVTAFTAVLTTLSNVGPGLNGVGPTENFAAFSPAVRLRLAAGICRGGMAL